MAAPSAPVLSFPERMYGILTAYQQTFALRTAIELDLFSLIADGAHDIPSIAKKTGAADRGLRPLCNFLTILGFLTKEGTDRYSLTPEANTFLNRKSPAYMGAVAGFLSNDTLFKKFSMLTDSVKKGGSAADHGDNLEVNDDMWVAFARSMGNTANIGAAFIAKVTNMPEGKPCKVLDIAAGHGMYGITMAKHNPNAQIVALDWPNVLAVAKENADAAGVANRYKLLPGSAFEVGMGEGYDYVLLTNIFHHFDPPTCEKLMQRVLAALKPGGQAVTLEFVPNDDRVSPPPAAMFSLVMLATTANGDAYTASEYQKMFHNAGFSKTTAHSIPEIPHRLLISEK
jgi:ubiquinone/menaquinone biosynthesis C-methylase UbiE